MELAGIIISGVGLVALESTVEDIFTKISTWRHQGKDYEQASLDLELASIAYQRWHKSVVLVEPNSNKQLPDLPTATPHEAETVRKLLGAIELAFKDVEKTSKKYEIDESAIVPPKFEAKMSAGEMLLANARAINKTRQAGTGTLQKIKWMMHDKKALETLIAKMEKNIKQLVELFPQAAPQFQEALATVEVGQMVPVDEVNEEREKEMLVLLRSAAKKVDPVMQASADKSIEQWSQRNTVRRLNAHGKGKFLNGEDVAAGATAAAPSGPGDLFEDMNVYDQAKIQNGNRIGYTVGFLDD